MKIYTKKGDLGKTSLLGGQRVDKDDLRVQTYGNVDELNSVLGMVGVYASDHVELIQKIQSSLFDLGAYLSCPQEKRKEYALKQPSEALTSDLEKEIDKIEKNLIPLKSFILPGGHASSANLHWARTVVRRVERSLYTFSKETKDDLKQSLTFLNRLSDFIFVLARYYNKKNNVEDIPWLAN